jgi:hypothetical protein
VVGESGKSRGVGVFYAFLATGCVDADVPNGSHEAGGEAATWEGFREGRVRDPEFFGPNSRTLSINRPSLVNNPVRLGGLFRHFELEPGS